MEIINPHGLCDKCTMNSVNRQPVALSYKETMYHCKRCEYDLCQSCYTEGMARNRTNVMENSFRWITIKLGFDTNKYKSFYHIHLYDRFSYISSGSTVSS